MSFDPRPVTLEECNQSLRDSVNAYYTHAINDPGMSREDAIKSTGEMAENYLEAVEEFENQSNVQMDTETDVQSNEAPSVDSEEGIDGGEGCDDGLDME